MPRQKNAWMRIVKSKILGQSSNLLARAPASALKLQELAKAVKSGDPNNIEARAARTYWSRYLVGTAFVRERDAEGRNAMLNYGYAIVRGYTVRAICISGLNPSLGIWHHSRGNAFGLADDLMEPFRPAVDHIVRLLPADADLTDGDVKRSLVAVVALPLAGEGRTVATAITDLAQSLAGYVEGATSTLSVPTWIAPGG